MRTSPIDKTFDFSLGFPPQAREIREMVARNVFDRVEKSVRFGFNEEIHKFSQEMSDLAFRMFQATVKKKFPDVIKNENYRIVFEQVIKDSEIYFRNDFCKISRSSRLL